MFLQGVTEGVGDHLDPTRAAYTIVASFECPGDICLSPNTETLGDQTAKGITTG
jgi:hypothetical protein